MLSTLVLLAQLQIPAPVGYVNDFAHVLDAASRQQLAAVIEEVRRKSGGEIVVVTLADLGGSASIDVARDIGRQWRVGLEGGPGVRARNAGVVLLLKPGQRPGDGRAELAIATGTGAEGFLTDAYTGRVRDAIGETAVSSGSYAAGLVAGVWLLARAYAHEFNFELTGTPPPVAPAARTPDRIGTVASLVMLVLPFLVFLSLAAALSRGRRYGGSGLQWLLLSLLLSSRGGGWRRGGGWGGGGWGGGGFGGGGFGGFGGGGGFSGGGASGRF